MFEGMLSQVCAVTISQYIWCYYTFLSLHLIIGWGCWYIFLRFKYTRTLLAKYLCLLALKIQDALYTVAKSERKPWKKIRIDKDGSMSEYKDNPQD